MNDQPLDQSADRDEIGALIRIAGERPPVPAERFARVQAAARDQWRRDVASRTRRRAIWTTAGLAAAAALVLMVTLRILMFGGGFADSSGTVVETVHGVVSPSLRSGDLLEQETDLETGTMGRVALRLPSGHGVRIDRGTRVRVSASRGLELLEGTIYIDSGLAGAPDRAPLIVTTPYGLVEEIGTQFEVRVHDGALRVRLREGEVRVHSDTDTLTLVPGDELEIDAGGRISRGLIPLFGAPWAWSETLASLPPVEGRPALEFLEWVARERGWRLVFDGEEAARVAREAVLGGSVKTLTIEQALEAVLPTCGLSHETSPGALTVRVAGV